MEYAMGSGFPIAQQFSHPGHSTLAGENTCMCEEEHQGATRGKEPRPPGALPIILASTTQYLKVCCVGS